ncbi:hypothetical protein [Actinoplanes sp. G11-F43]|uniref:hypothetical protein n=1 Tax=Actinoplanes sp. G11-F43 TaxID=3424130 RepID=UPI003D34E1C7
MAQDSMISFGDESPRRTYLRDLGRDRRIPALTAGLGAVAAFGSLISEWQTTTLVSNGNFDADAGVTDRILPAELPDLGAIGGGYLVGILLLVTAVVLTLFGPETGRRHARLAGLAVGGVLLALLVAVLNHAGEVSLLIPRYYTDDLFGAEMRVAVGRGLWCAMAAVAAGLIALWMPRGEDTGVRPAPEPDDAEPLDGPLELSIAPAAPFVPVPGDFPGERDRPHRS